MPKFVTQSTRRARTVAIAIACVVGSRAGQALAQPVVDRVRTALETRHATEWNRTWNDTSTNTLAPGWLVQTPPGSHWGQAYDTLSEPATCEATTPHCDPDFLLVRCGGGLPACPGTSVCTPLLASRTTTGGAAQSMCIGHSEAELLDRIWTTVTGAHGLVDVTTLASPDLRFRRALRNAIAYLDNANAGPGPAITVRVLYARWLGSVVGADPKHVNADALLTELAGHLGANSRVVVHVAETAYAMNSWNHAKIVAADGTTALVGGHNMWTKHYLDRRPVHDLSLQVSGPAARQAHAFADEMWQWACSVGLPIKPKLELGGFTNWGAYVKAWRQGAMVSAWRGAAAACPNGGAGGPLAPGAAPAIAAAAAPGPNQYRVLGVGRLARLDDNNRADAADTALLSMIDHAAASIKIAQQDMSGSSIPLTGHWGETVMDHLARAILRGVDVHIVMSSPSPLVGESVKSYAGKSPIAIWNDLAVRVSAMWASAHGGVAPTALQLDQLMIPHVRVGSLRVDERWDTYPGTAKSPGLHSKLVLVDERIFYIGSQNLYSADLSEFGYIVDDPAGAGGGGPVQTLLDDYWNPIWRASYGTASLTRWIGR